ncbi:MAG: diguanylate cyclase [Lachnospiraceae bacterium]
MKQKKQGRLFFSLAAVMAVPIFVLGIILVVMGQQSVSEGMTLEIRKSLAGIARQTADMYSIAYQGEIRSENGRFYMGDADLTNDFALADRMKENTGAEITIFWGDTRVITTITNENGERIIGSVLDNEQIADAVFSGNEYYSSKVQIRDDCYFGYYVPLYNGDEVCGMVFAGMTNESVASNVRTIVAKIVIVFILALLIILAIASAYARNIVDRLDKIRCYIGGLAENNFGGQMPEVVLKRNDEIGEMGRHAVDVGKTIKDLISNDPLTGLFNRRAGRIELEKYMEGADRNSKSAVTVALGDIDFFKNVNDQYGHECGDMVLVTVAELFKKHLKGKGFSVRWGGEEFLLVYREDKKEALSDLEALTDELRHITFAYEEYSFSVTMTFGMAEYKAGENMDLLIKEADDLLYRGKEEGRNRIIY